MLQAQPNNISQSISTLNHMKEWIVLLTCKCDILFIYIQKFILNVQACSAATGAVANLGIILLLSVL